MKVLEYNSRFRIVNAILNAWPFCLDEDSMRPVYAVARDAQGWWNPPNGSLFYNGYFFFRLIWPLGAGIGITFRSSLREKWRGKFVRFQTWIGWKGNGRFALTFRFQTEAEAEAGVNGPNLGQAKGYARGTA